jgi:hypothetical protein
VPSPGLRSITVDGVARSFALRTPEGRPLEEVRAIAVGSHSLFLAVPRGGGCRVLVVPIADLG